MVTALVFHKCMTEYPQKGQRINAECYAKLKESLKEKWRRKLWKFIRILQDKTPDHRVSKTMDVLKNLLV